MSGRILLVDTIATNRILLRVKLMAAQYEVHACATREDAALAIRTEQPDLVILDVSAPGADGLGLCTALRADPDHAGLPIIVTGTFRDAASRMAALRAGADDVLEKSVDGVLLQARIRSLLRMRGAGAELRLRDDTQRALGFAESAENFAATGRIAIVTGPAQRGARMLDAFATLAGGDCDWLDPAQALAPCGPGPAPDLYVIDGSGSMSCDLAPPDVYRLVAELRSRAESRHAAVLIILPDRPGDMAAMVLDLGANDLASASVCAEEMAHRARALLRQKSQGDRLRATVRHGLQAAVTDPLTGLYNRRYAMPHLARMADRARITGRDYAVMILDIDHFKAINDRLGHAGGDRVLVEVARRLRDNLRNVDLVARIGGEEFLVALPDSGPDQAHNAAERLRRVIEGMLFDCGTGAGMPACPTVIGPLRHPDDAPLVSACEDIDAARQIANRRDMPEPVGATAMQLAEGAVLLHAAPDRLRVASGQDRVAVTVSIGVAIGHAAAALPEEPGVVVGRADAALYAAKNSGRNKVAICRSAA